MTSSSRLYIWYQHKTSIRSPNLDWLHVYMTSEIDINLMYWFKNLINIISQVLKPIVSNTNLVKKIFVFTVNIALHWLNSQYTTTICVHLPDTALKWFPCAIQIIPWEKIMNVIWEQVRKFIQLVKIQIMGTKVWILEAFFLNVFLYLFNLWLGCKH